MHIINKLTLTSSIVHERSTAGSYVNPVYIKHNMLEYYVSNNSHAFVLYIDASKAFDRVCHSKLFDVLQAHSMCPLILRALFNMYTHSEMKVRWESETSKSFSLQNGVKQGGCLSP